MAPDVKICGITSIEDALAAVECGADALGFNFYPQSPRFVSREQAEEILSEVPPVIHRVGVFVNADAQEAVDIAVALHLDCLQFHGDEGPDYCNAVERPWYKAFRLRGDADLARISAYRAEWLLVDAAEPGLYGGTGEAANWALAKKAKRFGRLILAGGLTDQNVVTALEAVEPDAVDVASGVEYAPGKKDLEKMARFIEKVKTFSTRGQS